MPWNGSGQFNRDTGVFQGATVWDDSRLAARTVRSDDHDTHDEDIATGLENTVTRDGQNSPSANLPMATFRHTGVGNAVARTDYAAAGQVQDQGLTHIVPASVAGTADAITLSPTPAITSYTAGQRWSFVAEGNNTGAVTVDVSSLGTKAVQKFGAALVSGDIETGDMVEIRYDGTQFQMISPSAALLNAALTDAANIFIANQTITSTDPGATAGPVIELFRDSALPADFDDMGELEFPGRNSTGGKVNYAKLGAEIQDATAGSEDGILRIATRIAGTFVNRFIFGEGMYTQNVTGGDQGADTINASGLFIDGVAVSTAGNLIGFQTFTASGTWTPTAGTNSVVVECKGSGGGGGGSDQNGVSVGGAGGGGGEGETAIERITAGLGATETITIGAAGAAGAAAGGNGGTGGTTSFGAHMTAIGGGGGSGTGSASSIQLVLRGGIGGTGGTGADISHTGQAGMGGSGISNAGHMIGGTGGGRGGGRGGQITANNQNSAGAAGNSGGGGGGAAGSNTIGTAGGAGGTGYVKVWEYS